MSAVLERAVVRLAPAKTASPARIALLGTGVVGSAFVARYARLRERGVRLPEIAWLSNSRVLVDCDGAEHACEEKKELRAALMRADLRVAHARAHRRTR